MNEAKIWKKEAKRLKEKLKGLKAELGTSNLFIISLESELAAAKEQLEKSQKNFMGALEVQERLKAELRNLREADALVHDPDGSWNTDFTMMLDTPTDPKLCFNGKYGITCDVLTSTGGDIVEGYWNKGVGNEIILEIGGKFYAPSVAADVFVGWRKKDNG